VLKKLSDVVNVVPVIAKSDSLTLEERQSFKERIKEEFAFHNLKMYPYDNDEFDDEERVMNAQIKVNFLSAMSIVRYLINHGSGHHSFCRCWK
jgi:septin 3/9/12